MEAFHIEESIPTECIPHLRGASIHVSSMEANLLSSSTAIRAALVSVSDEKQEGEGLAESRTRPNTLMDDETLLAWLRIGDQEAFSYLFRRYSDVIRRIGRQILRDTPEAEDLVQDLLLFIQRKVEVFNGERGSARSWIIQMAYQRAIERRRHLASRHFYDLKESVSDVERLVAKPTTEDDYSPDVVFGRNGLKKVVEALTEDQRETLKLYFFEGYTFAEIAKKLGQTLGNVRNHHYRGLNKLREQMFVRNHPRS